MIADRRITNDAVASEVGILHWSVHSILHDDLNMHRVYIIICKNMIAMADEDDWILKKIEVGDESWWFFTTLKQVNRNQKHHQERKNVDKTKTDRKLCWSSFSVIKASLTTNLLRKARLLIQKMVSADPQIDYEMQSNESDMKNGQQTIAFFYTTRLHPIAISL